MSSENVRLRGKYITKEGGGEEKGWLKNGIVHSIIFWTLAIDHKRGVLGMEIFSSFSTVTWISIIIAALFAILLIVLIVITIKTIVSKDDIDEDDEETGDSDYSDIEVSDEPEDYYRSEDDTEGESETDDDIYEEVEEYEEDEKEAEEDIFAQALRDIPSAPAAAPVPAAAPAPVPQAAPAPEPVFSGDSAFDIKEEAEPEKQPDTTQDSAFDINPDFDVAIEEDVKEPEKEPETEPETEHAGELDTEDELTEEQEIERFLAKNPVPQTKTVKKRNKKDEEFEEKFGPADLEIEGAKYFWYNVQDIADCQRKEDMYFHCHYFDDPDRAVKPLITEMYDCGFVKTEEIQYIAYGIKFTAKSIKEILEDDGASSGFDKSLATKQPSDDDIANIRRKWHKYVDNFLEIITINADDEIKKHIVKKLYDYGKQDVDKLIYDHY